MTMDLQGMLEKDTTVTSRENYRTTDNDDIYEEINKLYKQNVSASDIASRLGVSSSSVDRRLHKMGYVTGSTTYMLNMKEFILDAVANKSLGDMAVKYGVSGTTISDIKYACGLTELDLKLKLRRGEIYPQDIIDGNEFLKSIDSSHSDYSNNNNKTYTNNSKSFDEKKKQAVSLYKKGFTIAEITNSLHISHTTLYKALKEQSVDTRADAPNSNSSASPYIREIIKTRLELLLGDKKIKDYLNLPIGRTAIYNILRKANISNKEELEQAIADNVTVDDLVDSNNNIIPFNKNKDYGKNRPNKKVNVEPVKSEPDHNVDNHYVLQSHEPDKVPGFWKRLKYAFSANTNDLKD